MSCPEGAFLKGKANLFELLSSLAPWEHELVENPRSLQYVPPPPNKIEFRLGLGVGDLDRYLFGPNVAWEIVRPPAISEQHWQFVLSVTQIVSWSTLSPYDFIIRIHHLFVELALPLLLFAHVISGTYSDKRDFAKRLKNGLESKLAEEDENLRWQDYEIEKLLKDSRSAENFAKDPALILNRLRIIRNNVVHADPSVNSTGEIERWGGIYLRYFCALLEELRLVKIFNA